MRVDDGGRSLPGHAAGRHRRGGEAFELKDLPEADGRRSMLQAGQGHPLHDRLKLSGVSGSPPKVDRGVGRGVEQRIR